MLLIDAAALDDCQIILFFIHEYGKDGLGTKRLQQVWYFGNLELNAMKLFIRILFQFESQIKIY